MRIQFPLANEKIRICLASRATGSLQIKPSVSGNENGLPSIKEEEGKISIYISHFVALTRETQHYIPYHQNR